MDEDCQLAMFQRSEKTTDDHIVKYLPAFSHQLV